MNEPTATTLRTHRGGVATWEVFSPVHKVLLTSSAIASRGRLVVFDPIPLAEEALRALEALGRPVAVVLTNENHARSALGFQRRWSVPIVAGAGGRFDDGSVQGLAEGLRWFGGLQVIDLSGGAGGELAFFNHELRTLVVGDAIFNLPGHGLDILPARYCTDRPSLAGRLGTLLELEFDLLLMAHGEPISDEPRARLRGLLDRVAA